MVGGSAVYFSLAASLFTKVGVAANVGHDFPAATWDVLQGRGADLSGLKVFDDQPTFRWSGRYEGDMNAAETLKTELNVLATPPATPEAFRGSPLRTSILGTLFFPFFVRTLTVCRMLLDMSTTKLSRREEISIPK